MKPFLLRLGLFAVIQLVIAGFVLVRGNPRDGDHFYLAIHDKMQRMDDVQGPRLLLLGGSNLAFGIDCKDLEGLTHVPINLGLHAGLGLDFHLRIVEDRVRPGDIIVLSLEYELFSTQPNPMLARNFVGHCPEYADCFESASAPQRTWKYRMDHQALATIHTWVRKAFNPPGKNRGVYARSAFNEFGDMVTHRDLPGQGAIDDSAVPIDQVAVRASIERLNAFAKICRDRGVEVYCSFPPMPKERFAKSQPALGELRKILNQELMITQIDEPSDHVYETDQFYDTNYHLRGDAVTLRTKRLRASLDSCRLARNEILPRTATSGDNSKR